MPCLERITTLWPPSFLTMAFTCFMECALFRKDYDDRIINDNLFGFRNLFMECALFRKDYDSSASSLAYCLPKGSFMECALFRKDYDKQLL